MYSHIKVTEVLGVSFRKKIKLKIKNSGFGILGIRPQKMHSCTVASAVPFRL